MKLNPKKVMMGFLFKQTFREKWKEYTKFFDLLKRYMFHGKTVEKEKWIVGDEWYYKISVYSTSCLYGGK